MNWETILVSVIGSGVIAALVSGWMNHRTQIQAIKESGLYAKRADILDKIMQRIERLDRVSGQFLARMDVNSPNIGEYRDKSIEAIDKFNGFYKDHKHYLNHKLSEELDIISRNYRDLIDKYTYNFDSGKEEQNPQKKEVLLRKYVHDIRVKKNEIADEFRKIIGVK